MKICVLMGALPFPPRKNGLTLRYYSLLEHLSRGQHTVKVVVFPWAGETVKATDLEHLLKVGIDTEVAEAYHATKPGLLQKIFVHLRAWLPFDKPLSQIFYDDAAAKDHMRCTLDFSGYDAVLVVGGRLFEVYRSLPASKRSKRVVCDFVDSPSLHFQRRYTETGNMTFARRLEYRKYRHWEKHTVNCARKTIYISKVDAEFVNGNSNKVAVIPNGIEHSELADAPLVNLEQDSVGFVGDMSYRPNVLAVLWFLENVWHSYARQNPTCHFYIVGRDPIESVCEAAKHYPNVVVTGRVENIWSYYRSIKLFVCPLFTGAGLQNKVIEAMFAARPVISTPVANAGVNAIANDSILLAENAQEFIAALDALRNHPEHRENIGNNGREFAESHFNWEQIIKHLEQLLAE